MEIKDFKVEQWMNAWETTCRHNVAETCTYSVTLNQFFDICDGDGTEGSGRAARDEFLDAFAERRLTYGDIEGLPAFLDGICDLYETVRPGHVITTHGAAGANHLVLSTLCGPGDHVVSVMPTYQQLYSIPEMCGADVRILHLEKDRHYHVDPEKLEALCGEDTKVICINNPNNPTGSLLDEGEVRAIVDIAKDHDAWLMFDEVYRLLVQDSDAFTTSPIDLYDGAVVVSSMSKVWSLAGIRLGWCITKSEKLRHDLLSHRDYDLISCGLFDEEVAALRPQSQRRDPQPQSPHRPTEPPGFLRLGRVRAAPLLREARGRYRRARLLRLRHRLLRLLHPDGPGHRRPRHPG